VESDIQALSQHSSLSVILGACTEDTRAVSLISFKSVLEKYNYVLNQLSFVPCNVYVETEDAIEESKIVLPKEFSPFELLKLAKNASSESKNLMKKLYHLSSEEDVLKFTQLAQAPRSVALKLLYTQKRQI